MIGAAVGFGVVGLVVAALMVGLWLGERGRRIAAENIAVLGTPAISRAEVRRPEPEPEAVLGQPFTESDLEAAAEFVVKEARKDGRKISKAEARAEAKTLLFGGIDFNSSGPSA